MEDGQKACSSPSVFRLAALAILCSLSVAGTAKAQTTTDEDTRESVALLPLEGQRLDPTLVKICSELLTDHLGTYANRKLITSSDIQAMLSLEEQKMALACEDQASCIAEIGGALGVDEIRASLSRLGSKLIVSMTQIHVQSASVLKRSTIKIENDEDLYDEALKAAVLELYEQKSAPKRTQRRADRRELVVDTMTAPVAEGGPDLIEWTVMSMGAGAVTGGLVFDSLLKDAPASLRASAVNWPLKKPKTSPRLPMSLRARWCWYRDRSCTLVFRRRRPIRPCVCAVANF